MSGTGASAAERKAELLQVAGEFFKRAGKPDPKKGIYGAYAVWCAERGDFDEMNACFTSFAAGGKDRSAPPGSPDAGHYHFDLLIALLHLYFKFRDKLRPEAIERFRRALREACEPQGRIYRYDFGFSNTNHPFKCATIEALAGEILEDEDVRLSGVNKLRGLSRKLAAGVGRPYANTGYLGAVSEFNSPTYAAPQLIPATLLRNWSQFPEVRALGALYQELMLMDVLGHWHPPTQQSAGPHSRAYTENTIGGTGLLKYILHAVLPGGVFFDIETAWWASHAGDVANAALAASVDFHVPDFLVRFALDKAYPHALQVRTATYGYSFGIWSVPPGPVDTYCYQTASYTLGSASRVAGNGGQMDSPLLRWVKRPPVRSMDDHKAAFFRYREGASYTFRQSSVLDQGIKNVLQHEGTALALYRPRPVAGETDSLRLDICIPVWDGLDELYLGDRRIEELPARSHLPAPVFVKDGPVAFALVPLELTDLGREAAVEIRKQEGILVISLVNYAGPPRRFPTETLLGVRNGVVLLVEEETGENSASEAAPIPGRPPSPLERLQARIARATIKDEMGNNLVRLASYQDPEVSLEAAVSHLDADMYHRLVNGKPYQPEIFRGHSAVTIQNGRGSAGDATLATDGITPLRLVAVPELKTYAVYNFYPESASFELETPHGAVREERFSTGRAVYRFDGGRWHVDRI